MTTRTVLTLMCVATLAGCGVATETPVASSVDRSTPGCAAVVEPIKENPAFVSADERRSSVPVAVPPVIEPVTVSTMEKAGFPAEIGGVAPVGLVSGGGSTSLLYGGSLRPGDTFELYPFLESGGTYVMTRDSLGGMAEEALLKQSERLFPGEFVILPLLDHKAILTWADPIDERGARPHVLTWVEDGNEVELWAITGPEQLVTTAREMVCGSA